MGQYSIDEAYELLMSPTPYAQSTSAAMIRNFGAAAQMMAHHLRSAGAVAADAGDSGAAAQAQAEARAAWFDQVATSASDAAGKLDALAAKGNEHQATAETVYASYQQAVANDTRPDAPGAADMALIHQTVNGGNTLSAAVEDWDGAYQSFSMPKPPPVPQTGGHAPAAASGTPTGGGGYAPAPSGGGSATYTPGPGSTHPGAAFVVPTGTTVIDRGPGGPGSVEVGPDGGDFAGWFRDPHTGYYVDPATGREFDPVTSRWIDPVTGKPFGEVTQYATGLQGLGGASTSSGLLADTTATAGTGVAGFSGAGGAFAGLFSSGNTAAVAGGYGGMLPPSLSSGSAATGSLWAQGSRSLAVKAQVAESMLAREQAARAGRAYLPPTQAGQGAGAGGLGGRGRRPGYLSAEEEEANLFSSRGRQRAYLPPTQAGKGEKQKDKTTDRPDWLVDDDVFSPDAAPTGILGD